MHAPWPDVSPKRNDGARPREHLLPTQTAPRVTPLIRARDCGEPPLSPMATVHVSVREGNNHRLTFVHQEEVWHLAASNSVSQREWPRVPGAV